ncbi:MAG TPA: GNAT family N-acetyltransferase, partial [Micromonosporaceae bacterium]
LVVVLVRCGGQLVGAAALFRRRRGGVAVLSPVGLHVSDFSDVLLDDCVAAEAAYHLAREIVVQARGGVVDLPETPPSAAVWHLADVWPAASWHLRSSTCLAGPAQPMEKLIDSLPSRNAGRKRRKLRQIEAQQLAVKLVDSARAAEAVNDLLRLHREQWRGRGMTREHGRARFGVFLSRAARTMIERGEAAISEYRQDGRLVCVDLTLLGHDLAGGYLAGIDPRLRQRVDVTALLLRQNLDLACQFGRSTLSLLRGAEEHKLGWRPVVTANRRLLLAGTPAVTARAYAELVRARSRLVDLLGSRLPKAHRLLHRMKAWLPSFT